jgi:plasmid stabilization system protein ParE
MKFNVISEAGAEEEWRAAFEWYEEREPGLGLRFDDELRAFPHTLANNPERFRRFSRFTHVAKVPAPWPYLVYFTIDKAHHEVKIQAIWHCARNPSRLRRRLK